MEDSLELPDENEEINVNSLLSPEPAIKDSRENTPPHSLAYSNCSFLNIFSNLCKIAPWGNAI